MKQNRFKRFLTLLGIFILAVILLIVIIAQFLKWYTHHGESLTVPDFKGRSVEQVEEICNDKNLRYEVKDSIFAPDLPKLTVLDQNPKAGSKVKLGRRIYLIINSDRPPKVPLPNLENVQLRQAVKILESYGLKQGKLEYKPDIALNAVLEMRVNGKTLLPGAQVDKGTRIDLVLGDGGQSAPPIEIPDLMGKTFDEGLIIIRGNYLNLGTVIKDAGVTDSSKAIIYKQRPLAGGGKTVSQGSAIDLWIEMPEKYNSEQSR